MPNSKYQDIAFAIRPTNSDDLSSLIENLSLWLTKREKNIYFLDKEEKRIKKELPPNIYKEISFIKEDDLFHRPDLIISLGGDGTLIGVSRLSKGKIPIVGVNKGHLGFITEFQQSEIFESLDQILNGNFQPITKPLFHVSIERNKKEIFSSHFFNDVVFSKNDIARMFTLNISSQNGFIYDITGDGLIVSSTVGSTAYSLAAGGPIVEPEVGAMILTPMHPHSLTHRPIVISDTSKLKVKISRRDRSVLLTLDGQEVYEIIDEDEVKIQKSTRNVLFIANPNKNYFRTLREKFIHPRTG